MGAGLLPGVHTQGEARTAAFLLRLSPFYTLCDTLL